MKSGDLANKPAWGRSVQQWYTARYWTQQRIAENIGCSQSTISYWLRKWGLKSYGMGSYGQWPPSS